MKPPTPPRAGGFGSIISVLKAPPGGHVKFCRLALEVQRVGWWRRGVLADSVGSYVTLPNPGATRFAQSFPLGLFCHSEACHFHMCPPDFLLSTSTARMPTRRCASGLEDIYLSILFDGWSLAQLVACLPRMYNS